MDKRNSEQKHTGGAAWYEHPAIGKSLHIGGIVMKMLTILLLILAITGIISGVALLIYLSTSFNPEKDLPNLDNIDAESTNSKMIAKNHCGRHSTNIIGTSFCGSIAPFVNVFSRISGGRRCEKAPVRYAAQPTSSAKTQQTTAPLTIWLSSLIA